MAITRSTLLAAEGSSSTFVSSSISPNANRLALFSIQFNWFGGGAAPTSVSLSGGGVTWVQVGSIVAQSGGVSATALFRALSGSPGSGAVTITHDTTSTKFVTWSVEEFDGVDTGGTNGSAAVVQVASMAGPSANPQVVSATLAALGDAVNNATYITCSSGSAISSSTHTTIIDTLVSGATYRHQVLWSLPGNTSASVTETTAFDPNQGIAVEIKAASGGSPALDDSGVYPGFEAQSNPLVISVW